MDVDTFSMLDMTEELWDDMHPDALRDRPVTQDDPNDDGAAEVTDE